MHAAGLVERVRILESQQHAEEARRAQVRHELQEEQRAHREVRGKGCPDGCGFESKLKVCVRG